jgi:hypothetical protein
MSRDGFTLGVGIAVVLIVVQVVLLYYTGVWGWAA